MDTPEITPHPFATLGGKRRVPNPKEYHVGSVSAPVYTFPATKAKPANRTYYYQGKRPACGAHAGTSFMDSMLMQKAGKPLQNNTPREVWARIKQDGTSPSDGTTMDRIFAALGSTGVVPFEPLENNVTFDDADYANINALTPAVIAQENQTKLLSHAYLTDQSFRGIKQAINDFGVVIILFDVCARLYTAANDQVSWEAADVCPLVPPSTEFPIIDGHFMIADYYDETNIYGANSFSQQWGINGDFSFQENYIPYVVEAAVGRVSVPAPVVTPTPSTPTQVIQQSIPQIQEAISDLSTLTPEQKAAHISLIQRWLNDLTSLAENVT